MGDNLAKVIDQYLDSSRYAGHSESTKDGYKRYLLLTKKSIGDMSVHDVKPYVIQALLDELDDFPAKQSNVCTAIKSMESWALLRNLLPHAITVRNMELVGSDGGFDPWEDEQIRIAIDNVPAYLVRVIKLEINTGQRSCDVIKMRPSDLEAIGGRLGINVIQKKTGRKLWIPFLAEFADEVRGWDKTLFLALDKNGRPYGTRNRLSKDWGWERNNNPALVSLRDPPKVLHGLRATKVVQLINEGLTELQISDLIGMSKAMVHRYSRHANQKKQASASVEQLENFRGQKSNLFQKKAEGNQ